MVDRGSRHEAVTFTGEDGPQDTHGTTPAGVRWTSTGRDRWCIECIARVDDDVEDPAEQAERWDAIPDDDGILHARLKEPR